MFSLQHPVLIEDEVYDAAVQFIQNGMPDKNSRTKLHFKARDKVYSLRRSYNAVTCRPWNNPVTKQEETRIYIDDKVVLKKGDKHDLVNWHR